MAFTDMQYDNIMQSYYQHQIENREIESARKQEVYEKIPRIQEIDQLLATTSIDAIRTRLIQGTDTTSSTRDNHHALISEKKNLLIQNGYTEDYLQPIYTCPHCKDTGRIGGEFCSCFNQAAISLLYKESTLEKILEKENFTYFDLDFYPKESDGVHPYTPYENMDNILKSTKTFIETFDKTGDNLLFYGETGTGKTFLSNCIAKALLDSKHTVLYQSAIHLFEQVCGDAIMKKDPNPESQRLYRYLYNCDLLIIDDLGTEFTNSFVSSELYNILNARMLAKKSTIISTNLSLQEITDRYSDRISTRIFAEYKVYNFYGNNIRLAKRRKAIQN